MLATETAPIDWSNKENIETLFPAYRKEQIRMDKKSEPRSKVIQIESFSLKSPFGDKELFVDTKIAIEANKRCAVYGINGSGKTCLFEAINNGEIHGFPKHLLMHHMKELEHDEVKDAVSVLDTVMTSHEYRNALVLCLNNIRSELETEEDAARKEALEANLAYVEKEMLGCQGDEERAREYAVGMLRVLGFDEIGEQAPLSSLSGGLRMRVALAVAFFINPDVLFLDEPTNHLDLPSVLWLENKLRAYKGAFLLVTHDRTLLENVVYSVLLIQDAKLKNFACNFKEFEVEREASDQAKEKNVLDFLKRNKNCDPNSFQYKVKVGHEKWLEARYERNIMLQGKFTFSSPKELPLPVGVKNQADISLIKVENVRFSYDPETLPFIFDTPISYDIKMGTRVGIMGPNGAGKSTFLKLITGKLTPVDGTITHNKDFVTAYFGQHSTKELDLEMSAMEFMAFKFPKALPGVLKSHLAKTSVGDSIMESRMKNLSFSQRSCVIFAALTFVPPHLLIMDEPTNFLDLDSVDSLAKAANKFKGGLVVVTHNRDFLKRTAGTFLSIIPGAFLEFPTMKDAERATYSFITALENGQAVDVKKAIQDNRGGGAVHNEKDQAIRVARLKAQQAKAQAEHDALKAEEERVAAIALEKETKRLAKLAALRDDWAAGEICWAPIKGKWVQVEVVRNLKAMGVTVKTPTGASVMVEANFQGREGRVPGS